MVLLYLYHTFMAAIKVKLGVTERKPGDGSSLFVAIFRPEKEMKL